MLTQEKIDQWREPIQAARKYARRSRKGLPADRWCDGTDGAQMVARGIEAQAEMIEALASAFTSLWTEKIDAGAESMGLGPVPEKYATKE